MFTNFIMTFIPLFVAFDAIGVLPIYLSLTQDMDTDVRARVLRHSIITASAITVLFLLIGKGIFIILWDHDLGFSDRRGAYPAGDRHYGHHLFRTKEPEASPGGGHSPYRHPLNRRSGSPDDIDHVE